MGAALACLKSRSVKTCFLATKASCKYSAVSLGRTPPTTGVSSEGRWSSSPAEFLEQRRLALKRPCTPTY